MYKEIPVNEAVSLLKDGSMVAVSSFTAVSLAEEIIEAAEESFLNTGHPRDLNIFHCAGAGNYKDMGLSRLAHPGMVHAVYGSHLGAAPGMQPLVYNNQVESYTIPQGVCCHLARTLAGGEDGLLTKVGLGTFADPRLDGCRMNAISKDTVVDLVNLHGKEYLYYHIPPIDIALIKVSRADRLGNLSLKYEPVYVEQLHMAAAAKANGGIVIAICQELCRDEVFNASEIKVPGRFVDYIVEGTPGKTFQTHIFEGYHPELNGEDTIELAELPVSPLNLRKICGKRGAMEIRQNDLVNIGGGMSEAVATVAAEEGISTKFQFSVESGIIGGVPIQGAIGLAYNPEIMLTQSDTFDLYNGGCLDLSFLGCAQVDREGNVNVTRFGSHVIGPGGFVNITQSAKKICFLGSFMSGKSDIVADHGQLKINKEGNIVKFVDKVEQVSFSGRHAIDHGQEILYITERCVFTLTPEGVMLIEIAPGVRLEEDILAHMDFRPLISPQLTTMDPAIFMDQNMNLKEKFD